MKKVFGTLTLGLIIISCQKSPTPNTGQADNLVKSDINGGWYLNNAPTVDYGEFYFKDSVFVDQGEEDGLSGKRKFKVYADSIYFETTDTVHFPKLKDGLIPFYKILKLQDDTLWVETNMKYMGWWDTLAWVKIPDNDPTYFELRWTKENTDSLNHKVIIDFKRRMMKYYSLTYKGEAARKYDSLTNADFWTWTMKNIKAKREFLK